MPKTDASFDPADYAPVAERIATFWERYPTGRIVTRLVKESERQVLFEARVYRSPDEQRPAATGFAAERPGDGLINTVACVENTETSAVGRALANLGITAGRQRPSLEEMAKAARARQASAAAESTRPPVAGTRPRAESSISTPGASRSTIDGPSPQLVGTPATPDERLELEELLCEAERRGWPEPRAAEVRRRTADPTLTSAESRSLGAEIRRWLQRLDRAHPPPARARAPADS